MLRQMNQRNQDSLQQQLGYNQNVFGNGFTRDPGAYKTPQPVKNEPDAQSSLLKPKNLGKVMLVVMRPKSDWSLVDWDIKINGKQYDSIDAVSTKILEIDPGQYDMTCGAFGIGTCIQFKANAGSTQYVTAEWERFTVLPNEDGEAMYRDIQKMQETASSLTPRKAGNRGDRGSYSTR